MACKLSFKLVHSSLRNDRSGRPIPTNGKRPYLQGCLSKRESRAFSKKLLLSQKKKRKIGRKEEDVEKITYQEKHFYSICSTPQEKRKIGEGRERTATPSFRSQALAVVFENRSRSDDVNNH